MYKQIQEAVEFIQKQGVGVPETGIILGTGLSGLVDMVSMEKQ